MRTVRLYGHLGKQFGRVHRFDVRSPAEAISALRANFPEFAPVIANGEWRVLVGGKARTLEEIHYPLDADLSIVPAVGGSGGLGKLLLGAALIAASFELGPEFGLLPFTEGPLAGLSIGSMIGNLGISLVVGGLSQMLFAPPKPQAATAGVNNPGYAFNGAVNTNMQGAPVPLCYGRLRVGSQVISAGLSSEAIAL